MDAKNTQIQCAGDIKTKTGVVGAESRFGIHCSVVLNLPYSDPVWFTVIDILHLWIDDSILTGENITEIYLFSKSQLGTEDYLAILVHHMGVLQLTM